MIQKKLLKILLRFVERLIMDHGRSVLLLAVLVFPCELDGFWTNGGVKSVRMCRWLRKRSVLKLYVLLRLLE